VRAFVGINPLHPGILDAEFFLQQGDILTQPFVLRFESHARVDAAGHPAAGVDCRVLGEADDVQNRGTDMAGPLFR